MAPVSLTPTTEPDGSEIEFRRRCDLVFAAALELEGAEREEFVAAACAEEPELRPRVEALLRAVAETAGVLRPGGALSPELFEELEAKHRKSARVGALPAARGTRARRHGCGVPSAA